MGNRTFLTINEDEADVGQYGDVAFETNNFLAPLWFCLISESQYQGYRQQLLDAWAKLKPLIDAASMGEEELDELPEQIAFFEALDWHIPWNEAVSQMRHCLPAVLARYPGLAPHIKEWLETLYSHVREQRNPIVHLELVQFFSFYSEPLEYLKAVEACLDLWRNPNSAKLTDQGGMSADAYTLGGEHLPKTGLTPEPQDEAPLQQDTYVHAQTTEQLSGHPDGNTHHPGPKWREELHIWLLAVLLAAISIGIWAATSSGWLAALAFVLVAGIITWREASRQPRKLTISESHRAAPASEAKAEKISYAEGSSPIKLEGIEAENALDQQHYLVRWEHIELVTLNVNGDLVLAIREEYRGMYPKLLHVQRVEEMTPELVLRAVQVMIMLSEDKEELYEDS